MYHIIVNYLSDCKDTPRDIWIGFFHLVYVDKPDDLQVVLNNSSALQKSRVYNFFRRALGEGLLTAPVSKWRKKRRLISPLFSTKFVLNYMNVFNSHSSELVKRLKNYCDTNEHFDLWIPVSKTTLAMIWEVAVGKDVDMTEKVKDNLLEAFVKIWMYPIVMYKLYASIAGYSKYFDLADTLPKQILESKKQKFKQKIDLIKENGEESVTLSYMDQFLKYNEEGAKLTDKEIIYEANTMLAASSETNALTISFTLIMLAMNPKIQEKVYHEIVEFSGEEDRDVSIEEVQQMSYLEQCIRETLRLFPPIPFTLREVTKTFQLNNNFTIQENSNVIIPILMVHRNPNIYPNPMQWNPDNFAPEKVERRHKYSFLAFSGGARGCIGGKYAILAIKVSLMKILKNYRLETDYTMNDIKLRLEIVMRSASGYKIKIYSRRENRNFHCPK
ncbi:hypothetical protein V9T40_001476 [Parthenolecanium corni]|uniref:Cytochrome P450 n=1 Tax=Parthenolecanium corni TaxID=536013 RepID=A0AAN9TKA7_9HEMI